MKHEESMHDLTNPPLTIPAGTQTLRRGATLRDIQLLLGHRSLKTTAAYLGVNPKDLKDGLNLLPASW